MGKEGIGLLIGLGSPKGEKGGDEYGDDPMHMACKAMWKAIKKDDYEGFSAALSDYLEYRDEQKSEPEEPTEDMDD